MVTPRCWSGNQGVTASGQPCSKHDVAAGAKYVFHVASPVMLKSEDNQKDIVEPAMEVCSLTISPDQPSSMHACHCCTTL